MSLLRKTLWAAAILGTGFQIGHFVEHALQAEQWLFVDRTQAWMSGLACWLTLLINPSMVKGMEVLHLTGNLIFLATLFIWMELHPGNVWMRRGFIVEAFHLTEHISLTATAFLYGHAVGWSTAFGFAPALFGHDGAIGYRVLWHFGMNLIPSAFMLLAMLPKPRPFGGGDGAALPLDLDKPVAQCCPKGWDCRGSDAI